MVQVKFSVAFLLAVAIAPIVARPVEAPTPGLAPVKSGISLLFEHQKKLEQAEAKSATTGGHVGSSTGHSTSGVPGSHDSGRTAVSSSHPPRQPDHATGSGAVTHHEAVTRHPAPDHSKRTLPIPIPGRRSTLSVPIGHTAGSPGPADSRTPLLAHPPASGSDHGSGGASQSHEGGGLLLGFCPGCTTM